MGNVGNILWEKFYKNIEDYSFEFCKEFDIEKVKKFINDYWKKNHAVVVSKELMDWQYYDNRLRYYNIAVAKHKQSNEIHAIYAFIPVSHFDPNLTRYMDIWLSIWKVSPKAKLPMLGLAVLSYIIGKKNPRSIMGFGMNDMAKILFGKISGFKLGRLNHFYIINKTKSKFELVGNFDGNYCYNISEFGNKDLSNGKKIEKASMKDLHENPSIISLFSDSKRIPTKSIEYINNRFLNHPIYTYKIFKIVKSREILGLIITRIQSYNNSRAIRIVDYYGDEKYMEGLLTEFQKLLVKYDAEYIDFYNHGFSEETMSRSGFLRREKGSEIIVPNYFEPFEKRNIDLDFLCRSDVDFTICRADSDQDRPNIIK